MTFAEQMEATLEQLRATGQFRTLRETATDAPAESCANCNGEILLNLSGNDYLGIAGDRLLQEKFYASFDGNYQDPALRLSSSSSRLLTGNHPLYKKLEEKLIRLYGGNRAALVFNSGYHANIGILPALSKKEDLIVSDKLNHASIIDGLKLSSAPHRRFRHNDMNHLEAILKEARADAGIKNIFIITESIFSMDGDAADLKTIVELKERYHAVLLVDEAHGVGVRGKTGAGLAEELGLSDQVDFLIGTFGKAIGSTGSYVILSQTAREYLINTMRPFIFTTALPPVVTAWSAFIVDKLPLMTDRRRHLREISQKLRTALQEKGYPLTGDSHIVPMVIGSNEAALKKAEELRKNGMLVFAIRPPTVPAGTARLRFSLSAAVSNEEIEQLIKAL